MVELVDTLVSGASEGFLMQVRVLFRAQISNLKMLFCKKVKTVHNLY